MKIWVFIALICTLGACSDFKEASKPTDGYQGPKSLCLLSNDKEDPSSNAPNSKDLIEEFGLREKLASEGLVGWIHGSIHDESLYVFTWRRPDNFFVNIQFPMSSFDVKVLGELKQLKRHDRVRIFGEFMAPNAPLTHIQVRTVEMVEPYLGPEIPNNEVKEYGALPQEILDGREVVTKVHVSADGGAVLVIEYKDQMIPVYNPNPVLARGLYRNDKIFLKYTVRKTPNRPTHLEVDVNRSNPIEVVSQIACRHDQVVELEGLLVMFPKSPQIKMNVFALRTEDSDGVKQNYTFLVPDMDTQAGIEEFFAMNEILQDSWDEMIEFAVDDRNKFLNERISVRVRGRHNVISPAQANPQIIVDEIIVKKGNVSWKTQSVQEQN